MLLVTESPSGPLATAGAVSFLELEAADWKHALFVLAKMPRLEMLKDPL